MNLNKMKTPRHLIFFMILTWLIAPSCSRKILELNRKHYTLPDSIKKSFEPDSLTLKKELEYFASLQRHPDTVTKLKLYNMELTHWPDISMMKNLVTLESSVNSFHRITGAVSVSPHLKTITLTQDSIHHIRFQRNNSVETLILSDNELRRIPHSIKKLHHLKRLYINHNHIKCIPHWMKNFKNLKELEINYNQLKVNRNTFKRLKHLTKLQMGANNLTHIPDNINLLKKLRSLNFGINKLSSLPNSFGQLDSLRVLIFYKNKFTNIPPEIFQLHHLVELDFYYNSLDSIPQAIGNLTKLKRLYLAFNHLRSIPDTINNLKNLTHLYLHNNNLTRIPSWITSLKNLQILDIGYNQIKSIPDFSRMAALHEIDFQHNKITKFPWKLLQKPNLKLLFTRNNPYNFGLAAYQRLKAKAAQLLKKGTVVIY